MFFIIHIDQDCFVFCSLTAFYRNTLLELHKYLNCFSVEQSMNRDALS